MKDAPKEQQNAILDVFNGINKKFGAGSLQWLGSNKSLNVETISTGSLSLDAAIGGGIPVGRMVEIFGDNACGKTTLAAHIVHEFQKLGKTCAYLDYENAIDPAYIKKIGVDVDKLIISQPDSAEQGLDIVEDLVKSGKIELIIIDSVAAMTPRAELVQEMGHNHMGLHARLMSQALRKLTPLTSKAKCTIVFINQTRVNIGVMWGDNSTTTGGTALRFYASVRMRMYSRKALEDKTSKEKIANPISVSIVKNKIAPPFRKADMQIKYGVGIDKVFDLFNHGKNIGAIEQKGAFFTVAGEKCHGEDQALTYISDNFDIVFKSIKNYKVDLSTGEIK